MTMLRSLKYHEMTIFSPVWSYEYYAVRGRVHFNDMLGATTTKLRHNRVRHITTLQQWVQQSLICVQHI